MNIDNHVRTVLKYNSSVSLPRLGEFMILLQPGNKDAKSSKERGPQKTITFNEQTVISRGALEHHLIEHEGITYDEAVVLINEYVENIWAELNENKKYKLPKIGVLSLTNEYELKFDPVNPNASNKEKLFIPYGIIIPILILLILGVAFAAFNFYKDGKPFQTVKNYTSSLFSSQPSHLDEEEKDLSEEENNDTTSVAINDSTNSNPDFVENDSTELGNELNSDLDIENEDPSVFIVDESKRFFIILGSFEVRRNAQKYVSKHLNPRGYSSEIINLPGRTNQYVCVATFNQEEVANEALKTFQTIQADAWVFDKEE